MAVSTVMAVGVRFRFIKASLLLTVAEQILTVNLEGELAVDLERTPRRCARDNAKGRRRRQIRSRVIPAMEVERVRGVDGKIKIQPFADSKDAAGGERL